MCPVVTTAQQPPHVIRGRVTTDSGVAIPAADIIVTVAPTAEVLSEKSDSAGHFRVVVSKPTGEYLLYVGALGRKAFRQRVTIIAPDTVATITVRLARVVAVIAGVRVQATKARPRTTLGLDGRAGTDGTDKTFDGVTGQLSPDQQGALDAMAATVPGLSSTGGSISAFGLGSDANATVLNGLAFAGNDLPRDAKTTTRFRTSTWDPTAGGFSGVQTSVSLAPGGNVTSRKGHISLDAPALQYTDPAVARAGRYTSLAFDEGGVGALQLDKLYYNIGLKVARQTTPVQSVLTADPGVLTRAGLAPDSAARALAVATALGVPVNGGGNPGARTTSTISFIDRLDRAQISATATTPAGPVLALTAFGRYQQSDASTLTPTNAPAAAGRRTNELAGLQWLYARYFGKDGDYVNETTSGLTYSGAHGSPYADVPTGTVLIASSDGIGSVTLGGSSALASSNRTLSWETINQTSFLMRSSESFPIKVYLQSRLDSFDQTPSANRLGRYTYASLADFAANRPSTFSRTLNAPDQSDGEWIGAGAVGGNWLHDNLTLTGGARVDVNAFTARPAYNPDVHQLFGVRTDDAPNTVSLSPRLGFVWRYTPTMGFLTVLGSGANVNKGLAQIRGGIGKFRSVFAPNLLADATTLTGLPGGAEQLSCVGTSVPAANWNAFASSGASAVPSACVGERSPLSDDSRAVTTFGPGYAPLESWRGTLGWTTSSLLGNYVALDVTYSTTQHRGSTVDLNFSAAPRFALDEEAGRPVFITPAAIVSSTGAMSSADARHTSTYGAVNERLSDVQADARQFTAIVMPNTPIASGTLILSYAYSDARTQSRGFDANTAGDPTAVEWSPAAYTSRHAFSGQFAKYFASAHSVVTAALRAYSGIRFTPIVGSDINGDGLVNDRAFIFDPRSTGDAAVARGMQSLIVDGPSAARDCLASQLGRIATQNSCVGPWGTTMSANATFGDIPHLSNRTRVTLFASNITSGLDQMLHGSTNLRGWGSVPIPQSVLLQPHGFDPVARRFIYDVNTRFGAASPATTIFRSPFRLTIDVEFGIGTTSGEQIVEQTIRVRPSLIGTRASADTIKARYLRTAGTDIYAQLLRLTDSLALSRSQMEALQARQQVLRRKADSIYTGLAHYLATLPPTFNTRDVAKIVYDTRESLWVVIRAERPFVLSTLTAGQVRLLPPIGLGAMLANPNDGSIFFGGGW
jgi:hypothetical protein